jgi:hypothetical protein
MYSFAQRRDTTVVDEPLYGHYLAKMPAFSYHPGAEEIVATMENDGKKVIDMMLGDFPTPIVFFKQMTHHLVHLDWSFMSQMVNIILTRDPIEMLLSYVKNVDTPTLADVGYAAHGRVLDYLQERGQVVTVLDSKQVLLNPRGVLQKLCEQIGIAFDEAMLTWEQGARPEDGVWAKYWYDNVHRSTSFAPYRPKNSPFPPHLEPLLAECQPYYERLQSLTIKA